MRRGNSFLTYFKIPLGVIVGMILYVLLQHNNLSQAALVVIISTIVLGSIQLMLDTIRSIINRQFALDYIALLAIIVGIATGQYVVASVIVLMLSGGHALEEYAVTRAKQSLTALVNRIPDEVQLVYGKTTRTVKIAEVTVGQVIMVRKGEVIPLDGVLVSETGSFDESSLTGEAYAADKEAGDPLRSGTVNVGNVVTVRVTKRDEDSTYHKIIEMVKRAQDEKSPIIRLADRYSTWFTFITLAIALFAYLISHDFDRVLGVLVIATPCPLILATPIALIGGMGASAKRQIIVKQLASLETLSRAKAIIFDKTGTITLGKPELVEITMRNKTDLLPNDALAIAASIERNSLHPLAKALVDAAKTKKLRHKRAELISETIGAGIAGTIDGVRYNLQRHEESGGMSIALVHERKIVATFAFEDKLKTSSKKSMETLRARGLELAIYTGDKAETTREIVEKLGQEVHVKAECTPEDKRDGIKTLQRHGKVVVMVGDGINDAPALALADVGMVFSHEEHTAASEAADIVFLGGNFGLVCDALDIAHNTIRIALQSILAGIGLSIIGMILASFGIIPPITGALLQEVIDISVILNALRASRY